MMGSAVTLFEVARQRVGIRRAAQALAYAMQWSIARDALGHEPTTVEYADWWKCSERTAWREKAHFTAAFPGETSPARLLDLAMAQWDTREGVASLGTVEFAT